MLQKENGRWSVSPSSISQSGRLTAISCDEAANPAAAHERARASAFSEAVAKFKEDAPRMGIYAHNIPEEMWTALYRCGNPANNQRYSMVSWVFLGANGGWGVCGHNGCLNSFLVSLPDGRWSMEQITKEGGYFLVDLDKDQIGKSRRNFAAKDVPPSLIKQVQGYLNQGLAIGQVRIGYKGEWFVLAGGVKRCLGCTNTAVWSWANVGSDAGEAFHHLVQKYESDWTGRSGSIVDVGFAPNGGWVIIYDRYRFFGVGIPADALRILNMLYTAKYEINQIAFGPNDSWIIRANGAW